MEERSTQAEVCIGLAKDALNSFGPVALGMSWWSLCLSCNTGPCAHCPRHSGSSFKGSMWGFTICLSVTSQCWHANPKPLEMLSRQAHGERHCKILPATPTWRVRYIYPLSETWVLNWKINHKKLRFHFAWPVGSSLELLANLFWIWHGLSKFLFLQIILYAQIFQIERV